MLYYAKITRETDEIMVRDLFCNLGATDGLLILDDSNAPKQSGSRYECLKHQLLSQEESLTIDRIASLGKNSREIYKELTWFAEHNVSLFVLDLPVTRQKQAAPLAVLCELYKALANNEIAHVKKAQKAGIEQTRAEKRPIGRQRIPYPENWVEEYHRWSNKEITAQQFQDAVGLKKGTFYNLIKQYRLSTPDEAEAQKAE